MHDDDEFASLLKAIREEWNNAEEVIKEAEIVDGEVVIPAIYELRYAGRRIVDAYEAWSRPDREQSLKYLHDAYFNCFRARHDAIDAATAKIAEDIDMLRRDIGPGAVLSYYPDYAALAMDLYETRSKIASTRRERNDRDKVYKTIAEVDLPSLRKRHTELMWHQETLIRLQVRRRLVGAGAIGAAVLIILGHLSSVFGVWDFLASHF